MIKSFTVVILVALFASVGCTKKPTTPTLWIYTSSYNHVVQKYKEDLAKLFPNVEFKWYTAGSENVAAKVNGELLSGKTQADLIMTSDLFWYEDLKNKKALLAYESPIAAKVPPVYKDSANFWAVNRVPIMVIAYHSDVYSEAEAPRGFADLALPRFKDKVAMGSPLESGTTFTTVAMLSRSKLGWEYFDKLRTNGAISAGGNSAVMSRIETKERPVGIVLLENVLAARRKNPKIKLVYPVEGVITIPSPVAITATTKHPELAKQVYDYFFGPASQELIRQGDVHSIFADFAAPEGALPQGEFMGKAMPWNEKILHEVLESREDIKQKFIKAMLE